MIMGGRSEASSECKSVTNTGRNSLSQDDKRSELKGKRQTGKSANSDKKNEASETSKLTYTSEEDVYYEPGGKRTNIHRDSFKCQNAVRFQDDMDCLCYRIITRN